MTPTEKAFGIICVALLATLVGVLAYCIPTIIARDNMISSLNTQLSTKGSQIAQFYYTVANLQNQVNDLNDTLNLKKSTILVEKWVNLWSRAPVYEGSVTYAGYIVVQISTVWPNDTLVVTYTFQDLNYENKIVFSGGVTATFPVLPSSNIKVFAFTEADILSGPASADVTITFYY